MKNFTILITTKNRLEELRITLSKIENLLENDQVNGIICDDGSTDGTFDFVKQKYPTIQLIRNNKSKGLIYSRNRLMNLVTTNYAISLDDDAHMINDDALKLMETYFIEHASCGVIALRIFWSTQNPASIKSIEVASRVKSFVGCGHVWNMKAWNAIPKYPAWFVFYGEEDFAAFQLFKAGWEVHYVPQVLVHHRVDVKSRKKDQDYRLRLRRSLRAGWYLYVLFYPLELIPKKFVYTLWMQLKLKALKGDFKALIAILQALGDVLLNIPRLLKNANRLTFDEFKEFQQLEATKLYWTPKEERK